MKYADVMSTVAIVMSASALSWQVYLSRRQEPKVSLTSGMTWSVTDMRDDGGDVKGEIVLHSSVTNTGRQAVTVRDVYWDIFVGDESKKPGAARLTHERMGPALPSRLDGNDVHRWELRLAPSNPMANERRRVRPVVEVILPSGPATLVGDWETVSTPPFFRLY